MIIISGYTFDSNILKKKLCLILVVTHVYIYYYNFDLAFSLVSKLKPSS